MLDQLDKLATDFKAELKNIATLPQLADLKAKYLGSKGALALLMKDIRNLPTDQKRIFGPKWNQCKEELEKLAQTRLLELEEIRLRSQLEDDWIDPSLRESRLERGLTTGGFHPTTLVQREIEDVFFSMGFEILDGPHIENEYYNFEALNTPADHPARDMQDTFWFPDLKHLLRTQTSAVQVRGMETRTPPFKFIVPGKCFRCERTDASHEMIFHQLEGMMVGQGVSVANLIYFMKTLLTEIFRREVEIRLRPGFFPFVEPGFELDVKCLICTGSGCSVCKRRGWVELLPCGMVHPNVLRYGHVDPVEYSGFAFGLGLDRLVMMRYAIDDIRLIHSGDLRFISQFNSF